MLVSKVVMACRGDKRRELATTLPSQSLDLPRGFNGPQVALPGVLAIVALRFNGAESYAEADSLAKRWKISRDWKAFP